MIIGRARSLDEVHSAYKRELFDRYKIVFNELLTLTNMSIKRFGSTLVSKGRFHDYMRLLKENHVAGNHDYDFNQQLGLAVPGARRLHLRDLLAEDLGGRAINVADHCYGCTAGQGSSCSGALSRQAA